MKVRTLQKNQYVISDRDFLIFQSYDSKIVKIDILKNKITFYKNWNYSKTTLKYLYQFLKEYQNVLDGNEYKKIISILNAKNKREQVQKLIDNKNIKYINEV